MHQGGKCWYVTLMGGGAVTVAVTLSNNQLATLPKSFVDLKVEGNL